MKSQAKKQKVAKKPRGEEDADPYGFESDEEQQDTGGKHENINKDSIVCFLFLFCSFFHFSLFCLLIFVFVFSSCFSPK